MIGVRDAATSAGIRVALAQDDVDVCAQVDSEHDLIVAVQRFKADVCLIDVDLVGGGLEAVGEIAARAPAVAIVLMTEAPHDAELLVAVRLGAIGYVLTSSGPESLRKAVRAVISGEPAIPRSLVVALINHYRERPGHRRVNGAEGRSVDLTSREWEVLDLMGAGLSTREIARQLVISEITVRRHIGSVLKKLRVASRADAVRLLQRA